MKLFRGVNSMPKMFVVSDLHGFYDEFIEALTEKGYDPNNETHWVIGCGDFFDRGSKPKEVMDFFMNCPRAVMIRGNHEDLLDNIFTTYKIGMHDVHNGTVKTIGDICGDDEWYLDDKRVQNINRCSLTISPFLDRMVDYFETQHYIFVHGYIPVWQFVNGFEYREDWRNATTDAWRSSRWLNGINVGFKDIFEPGKIIVCGHWHTSWGRNQRYGEDEWGPNADFSPFQYKSVIAIDACTAYSGKVNCIVIDDDFIDHNDNNEFLTAVVVDCKDKSQDEGQLMYAGF